MIITIDGPASSGKGTVAKIIAKKLGFHYLESGAIYRVVGLEALNSGYTVEDIDKILEMLDGISLVFQSDRIIVNSIDVTNQIREEKVGMIASALAKNGKIRDRLLSFQRSFSKDPGLVTDGRDMGSMVFPNADLKVFLTASAETRARRRYEQLHKIDKSVIMAPILRDIQARDEQDMNRSVAPLKFDESYKFLDNSQLSIDETVTKIMSWLGGK